MICLLELALGLALANGAARFRTIAAVPLEAPPVQAVFRIARQPGIEVYVELAVRPASRGGQENGLWGLIDNQHVHSRLVEGCAGLELQEDPLHEQLYAADCLFEPR